MDDADLSQDRTLRDRTTGNTWSVHRDDARTVARTSALGRVRETVRDHADKYAASHWVNQEEWKRLKKGMVLLDPDASWGKPRMHSFVGGGFTGGMGLAVAEDGGFFCSRFVDTDTVVHVGTAGIITPGIALPSGQLIWKIMSAPTIDALLLQVDGGIRRWSPSGGTIQDLQPYRHNPGFLGVSGTRAAWYDGHTAVVRDLASDTELLRLPVQPEMYGGHSSQMEGALSPDGCILALCAKPGEISVFDIESGRLKPSLGGDFAMVRQLEFLPDNRRLLLAEGYGRWSLRCLDIETGQSCPEWKDQSNLVMATVAVSPSGQRVAVAQHRKIYVHEFGTESLPRSFAMEHVVKRAATAWIGEDALAVRTDYGCASIYAL